MNPTVLVHDRNMLQHTYEKKGVGWTKFGNWPVIEEQFLELDWWLITQKSRVVILLGEHNDACCSPTLTAYNEQSDSTFPAKS